MKKRIKKIKEVGTILKKESKKHALTAILATFSFLLAFTWRDLIKGYVDYIVNNLSFSGPEHLIQVYATILTTIVCVIGILLVAKWNQKKEEEQQKK